jgi:two-component system NtrC family sensor kinase
MKWKIKIIVAFYLFTSLVCISQENETDSVLNAIQHGKDDSLKVNALISLSAENAQLNPDKAIEYATQALNIATKINFQRGLGYSYKWLGIVSNFRGKYYDALVYSNKSLDIFEALGDEVGISNLLNNLGSIFSDQGEDSKAIEYYLKSLSIAEQNGNKLRIGSALANIGVVYSKNKATKEKALEYYLKALPYVLEINEIESIGIIYTNIGEIYSLKEDFRQAYKYFNESLKVFGNSSSTAYTYNDIGKLYNKQHLYDSAILYFQTGFDIADKVGSTLDMAQSDVGIAQAHMAQGSIAEAITNYKKALAILQSVKSVPDLKDVFEGLSAAYNKANNYEQAYIFKDSLVALYNAENEKKISFTTATFEYSIELQKQSGKIDSLLKEKAKQELDLRQTKLAKNTSFAGLTLLLMIAFLMLRNIRHRKKLNTVLHKQKEEIEVQKQSVEMALSELKSAQSQLIQSEKMASLGELTAGIAHEIQNPLNFVNNFSEVSAELMQELKEELENGNSEEVMVIAKDVIHNLGKINHHGKRADSIVKGMLQHSRVDIGVREPTDINALVEEFVRLTYHGLKAKDNAFNAVIKTSYDRKIGNINVIPQDLGRVLLNLLNNAFYVVTEKKKQQPGDYEPVVSVSTRLINDTVSISVKDNGNGIPEKVLDKIFQPFFTTKPAGQGTGLGLSLSYDIAKAHGGELKVETTEGEGSEFIIQLPGPTGK